MMQGRPPSLGLEPVLRWTHGNSVTSFGGRPTHRLFGYTGEPQPIREDEPPVALTAHYPRVRGQRRRWVTAAPKETSCRCNRRSFAPTPTTRPRSGFAHWSSFAEAAAARPHASLPETSNQNGCRVRGWLPISFIVAASKMRPFTIV